MEVELRFKRLTDAEEWQSTDARLQALVLWVARWLAARGLTLTITDVYRKDPGSPHSDLRGVDVRTFDMPGGVPLRLEKEVNLRFPAPPGPDGTPIQMTAIYETPETHPNATGPHLHFQVHRPEAGTMPWEEALAFVDRGGGLVPALGMDETESNEGDAEAPQKEGEMSDDTEEVEGLSLEDVEALEEGPHGFQTEAGFEYVTDNERLPGGIGAIVVPVVLCRSDRRPEPQLRFLSPHELARGRVEVANRLYAVRVRGTVVIGRREDVAEIAQGQLFGHLRSLATERLGGLFGKLLRLPKLIGRLFA